MRAEAAIRASSGERVETRESIAEIDPAIWDSLVGADDLQATHRFVRACEESRIEDASYRHLLIHSGGVPAAAATLCRMTVSLDVLAHPALRGVLSLPRRLYPRFLRVPVVFCGLPVSFGRPCLCFGPGADLRAALEAIAREMEAFAAATGAPLLCFKEFSDEGASGLRCLEEAGYARVASLPACPMALPWRDFSEYLSSLRAPYRRQILQDRELGRALNQRIRVVEDFSSECPRIFALYEQVIDRARYRLERLNPSFLQRINDVLGPQSRALLLEADGRLLAAAILLHTPRTATFLLAGIDYEVNREQHAYPNLVVAVVEEAIRRRARALELGQTSYALKTRLGGLPARRWIYVRATRPVLDRTLRAAAPVLFPATRVPVRRVFRSTVR